MLCVLLLMYIHPALCYSPTLRKVSPLHKLYLTTTPPISLHFLIVMLYCMLLNIVILLVHTLVVNLT